LDKVQSVDVCNENSATVSSTLFDNMQANTVISGFSLRVDDIGYDKNDKFKDIQITIKTPEDYIWSMTIQNIYTVSGEWIREDGESMIVLSRFLTDAIFQIGRLY